MIKGTVGSVDYLGLTVRLRRVREIVPRSSWASTASHLLDILVNSVPDNVPRICLEKILFFWQRDQLVVEAALQHLLEACMIAEPQKTWELMKTLERCKLSENLSGAIRT